MAVSGFASYEAAAAQPNWRRLASPTRAGRSYGGKGKWSAVQVRRVSGPQDRANNCVRLREHRGRQMKAKTFTRRRCATSHSKYRIGNLSTRTSSSKHSIPSKRLIRRASRSEICTSDRPRHGVDQSNMRTGAGRHATGRGNVPPRQDDRGVERIRHAAKTAANAMRRISFQLTRRYTPGAGLPTLSRQSSGATANLSEQTYAPARTT
jgi:hypothetical protein